MNKLREDKYGEWLFQFLSEGVIFRIPVCENINSKKKFR